MVGKALIPGYKHLAPSSSKRLKRHR